MKEYMSATTQREQALAILEDKLPQLSKLYKECYLHSGRGALLLYAVDVIERAAPDNYDYRTKEEMLDIFDDLSSRKRLARMIDNYNPRKEGIMVLITDYSNATFFITVKLQ